ncbi:MAG: glycosyltransferase family 39 protein [Flavobacteriales bacterium]|nr:glycosyltransferase family 39 protein [Flavobacteriales bacterium]
MTSQRYLAIAAIALAAVGVRMHALDRFATGYDETFSVLEANGLHPALIPEYVPFQRAGLVKHDDLAGVRRACIATDGGNGILYLVVLHAWTDVFGNSNVAVRSLSLCLGLILLVVVYWSARSIFHDENVAVIALAIAAFTPLLVDYSQEARSYSMATILSLWSTVLFVRIIRQQRPVGATVLLYGVIAGCGLLTHYLTVYILLAHAGYTLMSCRSSAHWRGLVISALITALILGGWMMMGGSRGLANMAEVQDLYRTTIEQDPGFDDFIRAATPSSLIQESMVQWLWLGGNALQFIGPPLRVMALTLSIPLALLAVGIWCGGSTRHLLLILLVISGPLYALVMSAFAGHTFGMRYYYVIFSAPAVILLMAYGWMEWWRWPRKWARISAVVVGCVQMSIMISSVFWLHAHGHRGNASPEKLAPAAKSITQLVEAGSSDDHILLFRDARDALLLNLHFEEGMNAMVQRVDTRIPQRILLIDRREGIDHAAFVLDL